MQAGWPTSYTPYTHPQGGVALLTHPSEIAAMQKGGKELSARLWQIYTFSLFFILVIVNKTSLTITCNMHIHIGQTHQNRDTHTHTHTFVYETLWHLEKHQSLLILAANTQPTANLSPLEFLPSLCVAQQHLDHFGLYLTVKAPVDSESSSLLFAASKQILTSAYK